MQDSEFAKGMEKFTFCLHDQLANANPNQNIVYSPLSIRTSAGMLRMGAEEESPTAKELEEGLRLGSRDVQVIAGSFDIVLKAYEQCGILKMANRLYVMMGFTLNQQFGSLLEQKFHSKPAEIDFGSDQAASVINGWVESQTNELIKDLIDPNALSKDSRLVLVNAIHFKGEWAVKFNEEKTKVNEFFLESKKKTFANMMNTKNYFFFGELPKLNATALRLDYSACNLAMIILLPDENSSLTNLETMLPSTSLTAITSNMRLTQVDVKIPKFRAEFQRELEDTFKLMGMNRIFSNEAELGGILASQESISVTKIIHKAFIEVNELGTEAAAATGESNQLSVPLLFSFQPTFFLLPQPLGIVITARSRMIPKEFHANRPFFYAIYDKVHGILFAGRFSTPDRGKSCKCNCT
ncbi:hypothetical protein KR032_010523, partial [Drosophila birchii]